MIPSVITLPPIDTQIHKPYCCTYTEHTIIEHVRYLKTHTARDAITADISSIAFNSHLKESEIEREGHIMNRVYINKSCIESSSVKMSYKKTPFYAIFFSFAVRELMH